MTRDQFLAIAQERNVRAFLDMIAACEGTSGPEGYKTRFGMGTFASFADHPGGTVTATLRGKPIESSAAGRYQFLSRTWKSLVDQYAFPSFEPKWQDAAAVALIAGRGALEDVRAGRVEEGIKKCRQEWASFPGSTYDQPTKTLAFALAAYNRALQAPREEPAVSPFIIPALNAVAGLFPIVADLLKGESPSKVAERNIDAVEAVANKVLPIIVQATGAPNIQAAVEAVQSDPAKFAAADEALRREYYELQRVSIREAREFAMSYAQIKDVRAVVWKFTFLEFFTLFIITLAAVFLGWLLYLGLLEGALLGSVVMLVVIAGFVDPRKFWLGLPAPEQSKETRKEQ